MDIDSKTKSLIKKYRLSKNEKYLNDIFKLNEGFIYQMAKKYSGDIDNNIQNMKIGIVKAVRTFDFEQDVKFLSYAVHQMRGVNTKFNTKNKNDLFNFDTFDLYYEDGSVIEVEDNSFENYHTNIENSRKLKKVYNYLNKKSDLTYKAFKLYLDSNMSYSNSEIASVFGKSSEWFKQNSIKIKKELKANIKEKKRKNLLLLDFQK